MIGSLRYRSDFDRVRREGHWYSSGPLRVRLVPTGPQTPILVAFSIGRTVGNAVTRNRAKRRTMAAIREAVRSRPDSDGGALVLAILGDRLAELQWQELMEHVSQCLAGIDPTPGGVGWNGA